MSKLFFIHDHNNISVTSGGSHALKFYGQYHFFMPLRILGILRSSLITMRYVKFLATHWGMTLFRARPLL